MKIKNLIIWGIIITAIIGIGLIIRYTLFPPKKINWYTLGKAECRTIAQIIRSTGSIEAEDTLKIGSIVSGVIQKMLKEENDPVKKGEIIALIDDGKEDTEVRETAGALEQAKADLVYQTAYYHRQKALYEAKQLSQDSFESITRDYINAKESVFLRQAQHDKAKLTFNNKKIRAPENGIILKKVSTEGETVTLASPATIIYTIAKDIRKMKVKLEVDENTIGNLRTGQKAYLTFDTYPYKRFIGPIQKISNAPIIKKSTISYEATFLLDNSELLLHPGMTVNAHIIVGEKENILSVPSYAFAINPIFLKYLSKKLNITLKLIDKKMRDELLEKGGYNMLWVKDGNSFVETPVEVGVHNNAFFEIVSGLKGNEDIIMDIHEPDTMEKLYTQIFGKGL
jgi:HlyD family secretion protein